MDGTFFEKKNQDVHLQGDNFKEDSFINYGDIFFSNDVFLSQDFKPSTLAPTANGKYSFSETPFTMSDCSPKSRPIFEKQSKKQNFGKQFLEIENKGQPITMPQYDNFAKTIGNRFKEGD